MKAGSSALPDPDLSQPSGGDRLIMFADAVIAIAITVGRVRRLDPDPVHHCVRLAAMGSGAADSRVLVAPTPHKMSTNRNGPAPPRVPSRPMLAPKKAPSYRQRPRDCRPPRTNTFCGRY